MRLLRCSLPASVFAAIATACAAVRGGPLPELAGVERVWIQTLGLE